eukprot:scaffold148415_cov52-Attheya_sp.AAC.3
MIPLGPASCASCLCNWVSDLNSSARLSFVRIMEGRLHVEKITDHTFPDKPRKPATKHHTTHERTTRDTSETRAREEAQYNFCKKKGVSRRANATLNS